MNIVLLILGLALAQSEPSFDQWIKRGDERDARGEMKEAIRCYQAAEKLRPTDAEVLWRLSKQQALWAATLPKKERLDAVQKALDLATEALSSDPGNPNVHIALAVGYAKMMDLVDSRKQIELSVKIKEEAERSLALDPRLEMGHHILGRWHYELSSLNPLLKGIARLVYGRLPSASYDQALWHYAKAEEINPRRIIHHLGLARCHLAVGNRKTAIKEFSLASRLRPLDQEDELAKNEAAQILQKVSGRTGQSSSHFRAGSRAGKWNPEPTRDLRMRRSRSIH